MIGRGFAARGGKTWELWPASRKRRGTRVSRLAPFVCVMALVAPANAATFTVNSILDLPDARPGDGVCVATGTDVCTLRAAVQEANVTSGGDVILLPSLQPRFRLTNRGDDPEDASRGDLDIVDDLTIQGTGPGVVTIDGDRGDRIFDIFAPARVSIRHLVLQQGQVDAAGGAIRNAGTLRLEGVTLRDNVVSTGAGGGLANLAAGVSVLVNCTLANNTAAPNGQGGGVANLPGAVLQLESVTLSGNVATSGGAIHNLGDASIHNSIVANSAVGGNCAGVPLLSRGYNLDTGSTCLFDQSTDLSNADPRLGLLAFHGGLSLTMALLPGSDAIDRGDPVNCPVQDQRGFPRPADGNGDAVAVCDIGAFEVNPPTPTPTITRTATPTFTITPTVPTSTPSASTTVATVSPTITPTMSASPSPGATVSPPSSPLASPTASMTPTESPTPQVPSLELDTVQTIPGGRVAVSLRLRTAGLPVVAVQLETVFDAVNAAIAPRPDGLPDCLPNPALGKSFLSLYRPEGCVGEQCSRVRVYLYSEAPPLSTIADGSVLWNCTVAVAASAPAGAYTLTLTQPLVVDDEGNPIPNVRLGHGAVVVLEATATPTPTTTSTQTPTATPTATQTPTASATPTTPCAGDCSGDGSVTIEELITLVGIALDLQPADRCRAGDGNADGQITIEEIVAAVARALAGCRPS